MQDVVVEEASFLYPKFVALGLQAVGEEVHGAESRVEGFTDAGFDILQAAFSLRVVCDLLHSWFFMWEVSTR